MTDLVALTALTGVVISMGAYTGSVLGACVGAWMRGELSGDR